MKGGILMNCEENIKKLICFVFLIAALALLWPGPACNPGNRRADNVNAAVVRRPKTPKPPKMPKPPKPPKLSAKKLTIIEGKTKVLRIKNAKKASWHIISGKKYIKIVRKRNTFIEIKGKKAGTAKIRVKAGEKKLTCKVIIKKKKKVPKMKPVDPGPHVDQSKDPVLGNFGFDMLKLLHKKGQKNVLISPDSLLSALSMTALGAEGETVKGMKKAMRTGYNLGLAQDLYDMHGRLCTSEPAAAGDGGKISGKLKYKVANSLWSNRDFFTVKDSFIRKSKQYFGAEVYSEPFNDNALHMINNWVSDRTDKMIPAIIDRLSPADRMILLNAVCFEGEWAEPYQSYQISDGFFTGTAGKKTVSMMSESARGKYYMELAGGRGFVKYYRNPTGDAGRQFAFFAFLPPEKEDTDTYLSKISGSKFRKAYADRMNRIVVSKIPAFTLDYSASLKSSLAAMGMADAFTDRADFTGISDQPILIDDVVHKTRIEVDKNGTKAAAATAIIAKSSSVITEKIKTEKIILNRPFIYGIMDTKTGQPLFLGTADEIGK